MVSQLSIRKIIPQFAVAYLRYLVTQVEHFSTYFERDSLKVANHYVISLFSFLETFYMIISFRYDASKNTWTKLDMELPYYSRFGSAMFVDDNICDN